MFLWQKHNGFESWGKVVEGDYDDYENLDNYQAGIHEYFKYLKIWIWSMYGSGIHAYKKGQDIKRGSNAGNQRT